MEIAIPVPQGWHRLSRTNYGRGGPAEGRCAGARLSLQDLKSFLNLHQALKRWAKLVAFAAEYVSLWRHSGHWLFDSPEILRMPHGEIQSPRWNIFSIMRAKAGTRTSSPQRGSFF